MEIIRMLICPTCKALSYMEALSERSTTTVTIKTWYPHTNSIVEKEAISLLFAFITSGGHWLNQGQTLALHVTYGGRGLTIMTLFAKLNL